MRYNPFKKVLTNLQFNSIIDKERRLTQAESTELDYLLEQYDIAVLRRAHALALLSERGHRLPDQENYRSWRDEAFDHESVDSLYEKITAFQQKVNENNR